MGLRRAVLRRKQTARMRCGRSGLRETTVIAFQMAQGFVQGRHLMDRLAPIDVTDKRAANFQKAVEPAVADVAEMRGRGRWAVPVLLTVHAGLLAYGAVVHSPTYNEPAHLTAGISYWQFGRFDVYNVNPPLVRMVAALPVLLAGCETDWKNFHKGPGARPEMALGNDFCKANGARTVWLVTIARWACIPFSLLGGYVCFCWGRKLYGLAAGLLSLTLWCFCPNIIAHGQLITCDAAAAAFGVAACYTFWRWLKSPTWWNTISSGLVLGLAELTKQTLVVFFPLWPLLWLVYRWPDRRGMIRKDWLREFGMLCLRLMIALYVINLGYGFEGSFARLGDFQFVSQSFTGIPNADEARYGGNRFAGSRLGGVPVPLPKNYLIGIDLQRKDFESYGHKFYLGGVWSETGWWYYYLYALAVKVPLGTWLLLFIGLGARLLAGPSAGFRDELFLLAPAAVILTLVSSQTGLNEHMRYALPIFPFVFVALGSVAARVFTPRRASSANIMVGCAAAVAIAWSIGSSLGRYPHSLSYFNEVVGGPKNGWKHLTNSNIDWGQDLLYLKKWADDHPNAKPLRMALYGTIDPEIIDIDGEVFSPYASRLELTPGYYAVSATILSGFGQPRDPGRLRAEIEKIGTWETVGGSIIIFAKDVDRPGVSGGSHSGERRHSPEDLE